MRLFVFVALVCISLQIIYVILISLLYLLYSLSIPNLSVTLMSYSISLLFGALKCRKFFHLILSLLLSILALYTFFYHYLYKSRGFSMARIHVIPHNINSSDYLGWWDAINITKSVVISYLLGYRQYATSLSMNPKIVKRILKMLKLLGFKVEIRRVMKACKIYHQIIIKEVNAPRKGLQYLIRFAPTIEVRVWLDLLFKLLTKKKSVILPGDVAVLRRFADWWMLMHKLQEKGFVRIESRLIYCDDEMQECEYDYTIYIYP